ncbi:hypothetical protein TNCV_255201 [Trichonephila clavipes]|nr:hypothetical protein TNCV_255201 [Trichonephila clavipes]
MAYLAKGRRQDLLELAETLDISIPDNFKFLDIKDAILKSEGYDVDFTKECLNRIISDRKELELQAEREKKTKDNLNCKNSKLQLILLQLQTPICQIPGEVATQKILSCRMNILCLVSPVKVGGKPGFPVNSRRNPISKDRIPEKKIVDTKEDRTPVS